MVTLSSHPLRSEGFDNRAAAAADARQNSSASAPDTFDLSTETHFPDRRSGARVRVIGERYQLAEYLDSGGTADIFAAVDLRSGSRVAVKLLNEKAEADARLRHYFLQGARGAQRVSHPNLVQVLDVGEPADAPPFAVMEIVPGVARSSLLAAHGTLPIDRCIELALQAAAGLDAAHRAGVVHCDIKPENLLVYEPAPGELRLKVIDFDLAALDNEVEIHEHPLLRGTAKYMAPEQVVGDAVDARTDIYGLGVVLFRMLTGHLPFDLELCPTLLWHQLASPAPPPSWLRDELDRRLELVVLKALRKNPANRYANMAQLIADLRSLEIERPLLAEDPAREPDAYVPRLGSARNAAHAIARCV